MVDPAGGRNRASEDARQSQRVPTAVKVEFRYEKTSGTGYTADFCDQGMFLSTDQPAPPGTRIYLSFVVPEAGNTPIRVIGEVVRSVAPGGTGLPGMGIRFDTAYAASRQAIAAFVDRLLGHLDASPVDAATRASVAIAPAKGSGEIDGDYMVTLRQWADRRRTSRSSLLRAELLELRWPRLLRLTAMLSCALLAALAMTALVLCCG
jgi:uncharacterized protein (TIGR02266 family)